MANGQAEIVEEGVVVAGWILLFFERGCLSLAGWQCAQVRASPSFSVIRKWDGTRVKKTGGVQLLLRPEEGRQKEDRTQGQKHGDDDGCRFEWTRRLPEPL